MVRAEFKHLKEDEKEIAERWVSHMFLQGERVWDVHLDAPDLKIPAYYTKRDVEAMKSLWAKKIDLVVKAKDAHWIVEFTPKLSKAVVGGVLSYRDMYIKQFNPTVPVKMAVVCEVDDIAYHDTLANHNIKLWVV